MCSTMALPGATAATVLSVILKFNKKDVMLPKCKKDIIASTCALLNSGGGVLNICCDNSTKKTAVCCVRPVEQHVKDVLGVAGMWKYIHSVVSQEQQKIIVNVRRSDTLITVNYNLYLPSQSEVNQIESRTCTEQIMEILHTRKLVEDCVTIDSHKKDWEKDKHCGLQESDEVQFKKLENEPNKKVTLADRILCNKLQSYISAFANHRGGHIYCGISDEGHVKGQQVHEREKPQLRKKVANAIKNMVWPAGIQPQEEVQWHIFFEPVVDGVNNPIPHTFVIVIYIAPCPGGVFVEAPECYHIVASQCEKMSFEDWWWRLNKVPLVKKVPRLKWSSQKNKDVFHHLTTKLVQCRNNQNMEEFERLANHVKEKYPGSNAELIVLGERAITASKSLYFKEATALLEKFENGLARSSDSHILTVSLLYLRAMMQRMKCDDKESYTTTIKCLQKMELAPIELNTVYAYQGAALITSIKSANPVDRRLKQQALYYLDCAAAYLMELEDSTPATIMKDIQQKLSIYKVSVLLGSCLDEVAQQKLTTAEDVSAAEKELAIIAERRIKGNQLTHFRQIEYNILMCDLRRMQSKCSEQENNEELLKEAFQFASTARDLAQRNHFATLLHYADKRLPNLIVQLVNNALTRRHRSNRTFLGSHY